MMKYARNTIPSIHMVLDISLFFPVTTIPNKYTKHPNAIPSVIDPDNPIMKMVTNAVAAFIGFNHSTSFRDVIIDNPTITNAPTVHAEVIIENTGVKNIATRNSIPTTMAIRPVFAPALIVGIITNILLNIYKGKDPETE